MNLRQLFTEHPNSVGETYGEHMASALSFTGPLMVATFACTVHAFLPFLFTSTASSTIRTLYDRMVVHRVKTPDAEAEPAAGN